MRNICAMESSGGRGLSGARLAVAFGYWGGAGVGLESPALAPSWRPTEEPNVVGFLRDSRSSGIGAWRGCRPPKF